MDGAEFRVRGGGIYLSSHAGSVATFNHSTIAFNRADEGGGAFSNSANLTFRNSIVMHNQAGDFANVNDKAVSRGHNISDGTLQHTTDLIDEVFLAELANNGGKTRTHALRHDSPAINAARSSAKKDQRGMERNQPDIGAFEFSE